jgi:UDP-N-acetylglucosamine 2-epimerase (non-hydrolysing)
MHVLLAIGTRPEAIKVAPLYHALRSDPFFRVTTCITSQHRELLQQMLSFFNVRPDVDLQVMQPRQTLADLTCSVLSRADKLLAETRPDLVVVQGDTTTAFTVGLAALYQRIKVAHVEAGLRSFDLQQPFPEEANRRLVDVFADYLFAPTDGAADNLRSEGYKDSSIFVTGNTGIDALLLATDIVRKQGHALPMNLPPGSKLALLTAHRRESFGDGLVRICQAVLRLLDQHPNLHVLYPVHPNPNVQEAAQKYLASHPRIYLCAPLEYPGFVSVLAAADLILTDSGGVQEEAPALGKRVLVLRETTERPEGIDAGVAELVGTDVDKIVSRASALLQGSDSQRAVVSPYGDGRASARIVEVFKTGALRDSFHVAGHAQAEPQTAQPTATEARTDKKRASR